MKCFLCESAGESRQIHTLSDERDLYLFDCPGAQCGLSYYLDGTLMRVSRPDMQQAELDSLRDKVQKANDRNEPIELRFAPTSGNDGKIIAVPLTFSKI